MTVYILTKANVRAIEAGLGELKQAWGAMDGRTVREQ
jgi:hypothetical protein